MLGAFPAVLDDLNFKFQTSMFMLYHSVHSKERLQTRLQTNCQSIHSFITSPYWWESKRVSKGCGKWENREVRIDLAKNIMATPLKVRCKLFVGPTLSRAMLRFWCTQKAFLKKARACTCHTLHTGMYVQYDMEGDNAMCFNQMWSALQTKWKI